MNNDEIIGMLEERGGTYRLLARLFFKPLTQEEIDALVVSGFAEAAWAGTDACDEGCNDIARYLRRRNTGTREELACDFTSAFYGTITVKGRTAMPYESLFRFGGTQLMGVPQGEVYREFKANRVRVPAGLDVPEDHLSFMFDYLALLCDRAIECVRCGDTSGAMEVLDKQRSFLTEHVTSWYADFQALASAIVQTRFYRGVLKLTGAFIDEEPGNIEFLYEEMAA